MAQAMRLTLTGQSYALRSQESVAGEVGIHPRRWSRIEAGSEPSVSEALLMASTMTVDVVRLAELAELAAPRGDAAPLKAWTLADLAGWVVSVNRYYVPRSMGGQGWGRSDG